MTQHASSLSKMLTRRLLVACGLAFLVGIMATNYIAREEYDELLDISLQAKANLLLPLLTLHPASTAKTQIFDTTLIDDVSLDEDEKAFFWLLNIHGRLAVVSSFMPLESFPDLGQTHGFTTLHNFRFYTTKPDSSGNILYVGEPLTERNEAMRDGLIGTTVSMAMIVLIAFGVMRYAITQMQRSVTQLGSEISQKHEGNLTPIDDSQTFIEMAPAVKNLNRLLSRLDKAVEAERSFATTAAHELRTPLAVSLAHTQRLIAQSNQPQVLENAAEIETSLKKLIHQVERLLQFSRAQSGIGTVEHRSDINLVIRLMFEEATRQTITDDRFEIHLPEGAFDSSIDPDALAIILSNLLDNACKYSSGAQPVVLDARSPGVICISNDCDPLNAADLSAIRERFVRKSNALDGFGLGLSIVNTLCEQSGTALEIKSPRARSVRGFSVILTLPT